jgi:cytochrome c
MELAQRFIRLVFFVGLTAGTVFAQTRGTAAEAKALAEKAIEHIKEVGTTKAFEDFTTKDGKWQSRDLYIFVIGFDGTILAHGSTKATVGKNMLDVKDVNGKFFTKDMAELMKAKGSGWTDYMWSDPLTRKIEAKSSYGIRIPNFEGFVGVGIYK